MASGRRSATALLALVAYLASIVGGGLHHYRAESGPRAGTESLGQPSAWAVRGDHDEDGCAVCAAIHQAQAPPLAPAALTHSAPAADVVSANSTSPPLPFRGAPCARGPPRI